MYKELQSDVRNLHSTLTKLKKEFRNNNEDLQRIAAAEETELKNYNTRLSQEKHAALEKAKAAATNDLKAKLSEKKKEMHELEETHKSNLANMNEEEILEDFRGEQELYNEMKETVQDTNDKLAQHVGNRLKIELLRQLGAQKVELSQEELDSFIDYFNNVNAKLEKMYNGPLSKLYNKYEEIVDTLSEKRIVENDLNKIILFVLCAIIGYLFAKFMMPIYVVALISYFVFNLYRSYRLYETVLVLKTVQDNIQAIEARLEQMVSEELRQRVEAENVHYDTVKQKIKEQCDILEVEIDEALKKCQEEFVFDSDKMQTDFDICKQSNEDKKLRLETRNAELEQEIKELSNELLEKNKMLSTMVDELPKKLLSPKIIGESKLFDCKFLMDVENGKPVYFEHPKKTSLFLYDDVADVNNFIKLVVYQLRANINPYNFKVTLIDKKHLGNDFQGFVDMKYSTLFQILSSDNTVTEMLDTTRLVLSKRITNIKSTFKDIDEYNKSMIVSKSVTENYQFIFYLDMDSSAADNEVIQQLMFAGSDVGFYFHAFQQKDLFYKDTSASLQLLTKIGAVFLIEKGKVTTKSRDFIKEKVMEASNKIPKK